MKIVILLCVSTISSCVFSPPPRGRALFVNDCDSSIEVQHNDGTGRVFLLASGEAQGFVGDVDNDSVIPTYTIGGNTNKFYTVSEGNYYYCYTACHNEKNVK